MQTLLLLSLINPSSDARFSGCCSGSCSSLWLSVPLWCLFEVCTVTVGCWVLSLMFFRVNHSLWWSAGGLLVWKCPCPLFPDAYSNLTNFVGKADGLLGLGLNLASLGNPCAIPWLILISLSISFEKFPGKTMLCGLGAMDGLVIKVMASWTSKWWPSLALSSFAWLTMWLCSVLPAWEINLWVFSQHLCVMWFNNNLLLNSSFFF
jgi:hypothetical protein